MSNEYGKEYRVCIGDGAADPEDEVFSPLEGETGFSFRRSSQEIDVGDKDSGAYGGTSYGQQRITISPSGNLKLPSPAFKRLSDASKASPPEINIQIKKGAVVKFHCRVGIGNFSAEFPQTGTASFSCDLANTTAPIVDDLTKTV